MDILLEPCLWHYLKWTTEWRRAHKARSEKEEHKQKRQLKTNAKIKAYVEKMKEARKANDVYESGIGMEVVNPITPGSEAKKRKTENKPCKCGSWKHKRINHKDCILNPKNIAKRKKEIATSTKNKLGTDEEEQDALDTLDINDNSGVMCEMCRELREMDEQGDWMGKRQSKNNQIRGRTAYPTRDRHPCCSSCHALGAAQPIPTVIGTHVFVINS